MDQVPASSGPSNGRCEPKGQAESPVDQVSPGKHDGRSGRPLVPERHVTLPAHQVLDLVHRGKPLWVEGYVKEPRASEGIGLHYPECQGCGHSREDQRCYSPQHAPSYSSGCRTLKGIATRI